MKLRSCVSRMISSYINHRKIILSDYDMNHLDIKGCNLYHSIVAVMTAEELTKCICNSNHDNRIKAQVLLIKSLEDLERNVKALMK